MVITKSLPLFDPANSIPVVDRILKQQKAEREAAAEALAKEKADKTALVSPPPIPSKPEPMLTRTLPTPPVPAPAPAPAPVPPSVPAPTPTPAQTPTPASTPTQAPTPGPEHPGDTDTDRSSIASKSDSFVDGDLKGRLNKSLIDNFRRKYSELQTPILPGKGPQVPEKPITDLVTPLAKIGGSHYGPGIYQLTGVSASLEY